MYLIVQNVVKEESTFQGRINKTLEELIKLLIKNLI